MLPLYYTASMNVMLPRYFTNVMLPMNYTAGMNVISTSILQYLNECNATHVLPYYYESTTIIHYHYECNIYYDSTLPL